MVADDGDFKKFFSDFIKGLTEEVRLMQWILDRLFLNGPEMQRCTCNLTFPGRFFVDRLFSQRGGACV